MTQLEILHHSFTTDHLCPWLILYPSGGMSQRIKLGKKAIFNNFFPGQWWTRGSELGCLGVVTIDGILDGFGSPLEGLPNLAPKLVTCPICSDIFRMNEKSLPVPEVLIFVSSNSRMTINLSSSSNARS
jgi:hypothetical protein